ncbi:MAG: hypothetical protein HQK51_16640 [Oligoflexia bacterium]|nr:hypothetical protein [Oligoflexia bacterium]
MVKAFNSNRSTYRKIIYFCFLFFYSFIFYHHSVYSVDIDIDIDISYSVSDDFPVISNKIDYEPLARDFYEFEKGFIVKRVKSVIERANEILAADISIPSKIYLNIFSIHNINAGYQPGVVPMLGTTPPENFTFDDFLKIMPPGNIEMMDEEEMLEVKKEYKKVLEMFKHDNGQKILLPITWSYSSFPLNEEEFKNCQGSQGLRDKLKQAERNKKLIYFDSEIYRQMITHEYAHWIFQINILEKLRKMFSYSTIDPMMLYEELNNYQLKHAVNLEELLSNVEEIQEKLSSRLSNSDRQIFKNKLQKLNDQLEPHRSFIDQINTKALTTNLLSQISLKYNEFFADLVSALDSGNMKDPVTQMNIEGYESKYKDNEGVFRSFSEELNPGTVENLDKLYLSLANDPHLTITAPRIFLASYIRKAQSKREKKEIISKVLDAILEVMKDRLNNLKYIKDFSLDDYHGILLIPNLTKDNIELLDALKKRFE